MSSSVKLKKDNDALSKLLFFARADILASAYILEGDKPDLIEQAVVSLAKIMMCENFRQNDECGCALCSRLEELRHPDFIVVKPQGKTNTIKIEQARELIHRISLKPFEADKKIVFIEQADTMNEHTQNALLKSIEEPSAKVYIFLGVSDAAGLLDTVVSRCKVIRLKSEERLSSKAGSQEIVDAFFEGAGRLQQLLDAADRNGLDFMLGTLISLIRDIAVYAGSKDERLLFYKGESGRIKDYAAAAADNDMACAIRRLAEIRRVNSYYFNSRQLKINTLMALEKVIKR